MRRLLAILATGYLLGGAITTVQYIHEMPGDMKNYQQHEQNGTEVLGHEISQYLGIPFVFLVWPLWYVPNSWVEGK